MQDKCLSAIPSQSSLTLPTNKLGTVSIRKATHSLFRCNLLVLSQKCSAHISQYILPRLSAFAGFVSFDISGPSRNSKYPLPAPLGCSCLFDLTPSNRRYRTPNTNHNCTHISTGLYILSPKMKTLETGQYRTQSRSHSSQFPLQSVYLAYSLVTFRFSSWIRQLIVSVTSFAGAGSSTRLQLHHSLSQPEHNHSPAIPTINRPYTGLREAAMLFQIIAD